jgi:RHS repeat-associated protein
MQILYSYNDFNQITEIKRYVDGSNDEVLLNNASYNTEKQLTQFDYGNGLQYSISYDSIDRPSTIDIKDGSNSYLDLDFIWDGNNNITQITNGWRDTSSTWHSETESYSYDGLDRLTSASCTSWSHTFSYDKMGNITGKDSITYSINSVNEITSLSDGTSFSYDDNGNRIQKTKGTDTWDYTYDYANRLTKVEENDSTIGEYVYDGEGKRVQSIENDITTLYIFGGLHVLYEENTSGTASYIYGPNGKLAKRTTINQQNNTYYYHTDQIRSSRLVTDTNKNIISAVTYHPHGEACVEEGNEGYTFTGKEKDSTGHHYFLGRYYDSSLGVFLSRDPKTGSITQPQTMNRYTYALNNPITIVDPNGYECVNILRGDNNSTKPPDFAEGHVDMPLTTTSIISLFFGIAMSVAFMTCAISFVFGAATFAMYMTIAFKILSVLSAIWGLVTVFLALDRDFAEFWECMNEWLEENDYTTKNIVDTETVDKNTIIVYLEDGTVITIKRKKTGFEVAEVDYGDDNNDSSSTSPPKNISPPPVPI